MKSTASSVRPDTTISRGMGSRGAPPFTFSFSFLCSRMWAFAPPNPNEFTPARQPFQGCFSVTTYRTWHSYRYFPGRMCKLMLLVFNWTLILQHAIIHKLINSSDQTPHKPTLAQLVKHLQNSQKINKCYWAFLDSILSQIQYQFNIV